MGKHNLSKLHDKGYQCALFSFLLPFVEKDAETVPLGYIATAFMVIDIADGGIS